MIKYQELCYEKLSDSSKFPRIMNLLLLDPNRVKWIMRIHLQTQLTLDLLLSMFINLPTMIELVVQRAFSKSLGGCHYGPLTWRLLEWLHKVLLPYTVSWLC